MTTSLYWDWIESEAALIQTDGCSKVTGAYGRCCRVHDLAYYYARDPVSAYRLSVAGDANAWRNATPITRATADAHFRRCIQAHSPAGFFSPMALVRWLGLKLAGRAAWDAHRRREQETAA